MTDRISRRSLMAAGTLTGLGLGVGYALRGFNTPTEASPLLSPEAPITLTPTKSQSEPEQSSEISESLEIESPSLSSPSQKPSERWEWRLVQGWPQWWDVSTYTPDSDGGKPTRATAAVNFGRGGARQNLRYPERFRTLQYTIENGVSIVAVPYRVRWIHETLREYTDGSWFHRYRVRFPWYDPVGHLRIPIDRVPYKDAYGNLLKQRNRFDMFMHMPGKQARRHGVPLMPVEVFEQVKVVKDG